MKTRHRESELNFWPSIADMILAAFMVFLILWFAERFQTIFQIAELKKSLFTEDKVHRNWLAEARNKNRKLLEENKKLHRQLSEGEKKNQKLLGENKAFYSRLERAKRKNQNILGENEMLHSQLKEAKEGNQKLLGKNKAFYSRLEEIKAENQKLGEEYKSSDSQLAILKNENKELHSQLTESQEENQELHSKNEDFRRDKPPIISLDEASGYSFETGSARLSEKFRQKLSDKILTDLEKTFNDYNVDVIEIVGHTDGQRIGRKKQSNLDEELEKIILNRSSIDDLRYGSNADLGLMRALALAQFLKESKRLSDDVKYRVYSAAQLILPDGDLVDSVDRNPNPERRRIELRFTKLTK